VPCSTETPPTLWTRGGGPPAAASLDEGRRPSGCCLQVRPPPSVGGNAGPTPSSTKEFGWLLARPERRFPRPPDCIQKVSRWKKSHRGPHRSGCTCLDFLHTNRLSRQKSCWTSGSDIGKKQILLGTGVRLSLCLSVPGPIHL